MSEKIKNILSRRLPRGNPTHAAIMVCVGAYVIYMAYMMIKNTLSGASSMSMTTTVIIAGIMALCGLGVIAYGIIIWRAYVKQYKADAQQGEDE